MADPTTEGAHIALGIKEGRLVGPYIQGATFNQRGEFQGRTDVTNHGRDDHINPHFHPAIGPNSVDSQSRPILKELW